MPGGKNLPGTLKAPIPGPPASHHVRKQGTRWVIN